MKTINFVVTLTFSGSIATDDDSLKEIAQNIASSIKHTADTSGIAPEGCDEYTTNVEVSNNGLILASEKIDL
jgi:hypothetical protein